jgi:hypothetical protein
VTLFNKVLLATESLQLLDLDLRQPTLDILFHENDPSNVQSDHNSMNTTGRPDVGTTQPSTEKDNTNSIHKDIRGEEFVTSLALRKPSVPCSWADFLAATEFQLKDKSLDAPPQEYGMTLTKVVQHTHDIYGPLSTTPTDNAHASPSDKKVPKSPSAASEPALDPADRLLRWRGAFIPSSCTQRLHLIPHCSGSRRTPATSDGANRERTYSQ